MNLIKYVIMLLFCNLIRLARVIPNFDPIMGSMLPFAKQDKWYESALFSGITIISFDTLTGLVGIWTVVTAITYAALGVLFHTYYKNKSVDLKMYIASGVVGVLIYDLVTGVLAGPVLFGGSYYEAFIGQIPFTIYHLVSVAIFILLITPLLDKHVITNPRLEDIRLLSYKI